MNDALSLELETVRSKTCARAALASATSLVFSGGATSLARTPFWRQGGAAWQPDDRRPSGPSRMPQRERLGERMKTARLARGFVAVALAVVPSLASADPPQARPIAPKIDVPLLPLTPAPTKWSVSNAFESNMRDSMDVAASAPLTGTTALTGFRFRFTSGDHKLRRVGVVPKDRLPAFSYADSNGDDSFAASASWAVLSTGKTGSVTASGGGQFEISLPGGKVAGHKLVLSGFEFRRQDRTDANVRSIGVWLDSARATARVMLMDDQGPDFRGFERTIGMALLGAPAGELKFTADTMVLAAQRVNRGEANGRYRPYAVTVHYAWVPDTAVAGTDVYTGTGRAPASGKAFPPNGVLQGFEFFFTNSDHHLLDIGVIGPMMKMPPSLPLATGEVITFQDDNRDDGIRWAAAFANLKPSAQ